MKFLALLIVFILPTQQLLAATVQEERFLPGINQIDRMMSSSRDIELVMQTLLRRGRVPAFDVQGMTRFYRRRFEFFDVMNRDFKAIEDFIGKVDQWEDEVKKAEAEGDEGGIKEAKKVIENYKRQFRIELERIGKKQNAEKAYEADDHPWVPKRKGQLTKTRYYARQLGRELSIRNYQEDREILIDFQIDNIEDIVSDYRPKGFDNLELDNGIHPFRKDLRWILIEMRVTNGLFKFDPNPNNCDIDDFRRLPFQGIAKSKYSKLGNNPKEPEPCLIQQCVFLGVTQLQNRVAKIKDELEGVVRESDRYKEKNVPKHYQDKMKRLYGRFIKSEPNPWGVLKSQIEACK